MKPPTPPTPLIPREGSDEYIARAVNRLTHWQVCLKVRTTSGPGCNTWPPLGRGLEAHRRPLRDVNTHVAGVFKETPFRQNDPRRSYSPRFFAAASLNTERQGNGPLELLQGSFVTDPEELAYCVAGRLYMGGEPHRYTADCGGTAGWLPLKGSGIVHVPQP